MEILAPSLCLSDGCGEMKASQWRDGFCFSGILAVITAGFCFQSLVCNVTTLGKFQANSLGTKSLRHSCTMLQALCFLEGLLVQIFYLALAELPRCHLIPESSVFFYHLRSKIIDCVLFGHPTTSVWTE